MSDLTKSVCPVCLSVIEARRVVGDDGYLYLEKDCPEHGHFRALIWEGSFESWREWGDCREPERPAAAISSRGECPRDCGLCTDHENPACCVLLELTGRCGLRCPVCFADAGEGEDLPIGEVERLYDMLMERGGPFNIQLSGGEPTERDDLPRIVELGVGKGFSFFQLNTNGLRLASERGYAATLRDAGVSCVFLQFDGVSDEVYMRLRGRPLLREKLRAIANCASAGLPVVLVPTVALGISDGEIGAVIDLALSCAPNVRGVHIQPLSRFGRCELGEDDGYRLTIPKMLELIERGTDGAMRADDFSGGGAESPYCSFHASYMREEDGSLRALSSRGGCCSSSDAMEHVAQQWGARACCEDEPCCGFDDFIAEAHDRTFSVSGMVFQDAMTLDLERLRRCHIIEADIARGMIPFCAYNLTDRAGRALYRASSR